MKMNWYWFSYSLKNVNQGVCIVKADSVENAQLQTFNLKLQPKSDDIMVQFTPVLNTPEEMLPFQTYRLYSSKEMIEMGYVSVSYEK